MIEPTEDPRTIPSDALLEVRRLHVRYPFASQMRACIERLPNRFLDAVLDVSFSLRRGTTLAVVGESGSGKSTLGRAIVGLVPATSGSVLFEGTEPLKKNRRERKAYLRDVAMMFQDPVSSLSPRRTVRDLITEPFVIHGLADRNLDEEAERLLALVSLPAHFASRYPHQLSGGQARRVGVARAVALSPKLIIADEPTAGLDVSVQGEILNLMVKLQRRMGLTYLLITHNLAVVRHVSDETAIMYMGRIVEQGETRVIFERAAHPYTAAILASQPNPDPDRRRNEVPLLGEVPSLLRRPAGCEFRTRCPRAKERCCEQPQRTSLPDGQRFACHFPLRSSLQP